MAKKALDEIIKKLSEGDVNSLRDLYEEVSREVYAYSLSVLKSRPDAEDVLHDLMLEVFRSAQDYKSCGKPAAWVMGIARNLCLMKLRERRREIPSDPTEGVFSDITAEPSLNAEDRAVIKSCLELLDDKDREIVILHAAVGLKHREIAKLTGLPISTVLSKYQRSLKKLSKELEGALK